MTREQALKALELRGGASFQEIKQAYRDLALVWHPDRFVHNARLQEKASARLKEINSAYDVLQSYEAGHSRAHEPRSKRTGSKHDASGTEQSGTQRQESHTKNHDTRSSAEQTESQNSRNKGDRSNQTLRRAVLVGCVFAVPLFALFLDHQRSLDSLQRELIDLPIISEGNSRPEEWTIDQVQAYRPTTRRDESGASAADTAAAPPADLEIGSADSVLAVQELEIRASGAVDLYETFTRGSHQDDVLRIQGTPSSINRYLPLGHEVWNYGSSTVEISLRDGRVTEWSNRGNLRVRLDAGPNVTDAETFTRGSHQDDVLRIQGTPSSINRYLPLGHEVWNYGSSTVEISLRDGRLTEWSNRGNLKVRLDAGPNVTDAETFTRGSHQDDVLRIQGTPSSINRYLPLGHEVWNYGSSTVEISLRDGRLTEWSNRGNLKVRLDAGPNVTDAETFTRGSHQDDVLRIQGTPSSINRYLPLGHEVWNYGSSTVEISLRDGRLTEWSNRGNLKVRLEAGPR